MKKTIESEDQCMKLTKEQERDALLKMDIEEKRIEDFLKKELVYSQDDFFVYVDNGEIFIATSHSLDIYGNGNTFIRGSGKTLVSGNSGISVHGNSDISNKGDGEVINSGNGKTTVYGTGKTEVSGGGDIEVNGDSNVLVHCDSSAEVTCDCDVEMSDDKKRELSITEENNNLLKELPDLLSGTGEALRKEGLPEGYVNVALLSLCGVTVDAALLRHLHRIFKA